MSHIIETGWVPSPEIHAQADKLINLIPPQDRTGYVFGLLMGMFLSYGMSKEQVEEVLRHAVEYTYKKLAEKADA